jgi:hypothetical protein
MQTNCKDFSRKFAPVRNVNLIVLMNEKKSYSFACASLTTEKIVAIGKSGEERAADGDDRPIRL